MTNQDKCKVPHFKEETNAEDGKELHEQLFRTEGNVGDKGS